MDENLARLCIEAAKNSDNPDDWFNAGLMFANGLGVEPHFRTAILWFAQAAEQGHVEAMTNLGALLAETDELEMAIEWLQKAAALGDEMAERNLVKCLELMETE